MVHADSLALAICAEHEPAAWRFEHRVRRLLDTELDERIREVAGRSGTSRTIDLDPGEFRDLTLVDFARQALERTGIRTAGMERMKLIGQAFTLRSPTGGIGAFPQLLENTLTHVLVAAGDLVEGTWTRFCATGSVPDLREREGYRPGSVGELSPLRISRQACMDNDLGAFASDAQQQGMAVRRRIATDVYALLADNGGLGPTMSDGKPLFDPAHGNVTTDAALSADAIKADRAAMRSLEHPRGIESLRPFPAILLLPLDLGGAARGIAGVYEDVIDDARIPGTRRYLFADPKAAPTVRVNFFDGQQQPSLDMCRLDSDGAAWKIRLDYFVGAVDYRSAITNAGA